MVDIMLTSLVKLIDFWVLLVYAYLVDIYKKYSFYKT